MRYEVCHRLGKSCSGPTKREVGIGMSDTSTVKSAGIAGGCTIYKFSEPETLAYGFVLFEERDKT